MAHGQTGSDIVSGENAMQNDTQIDLLKITEIDIVYRNPVKATDRPFVRSPNDSYKIFMSVWDENKIGIIEEVKALFLNNVKACLGIADISSGGLKSTIVDPKVVFSLALKAGAQAIIIAHNHPSGLVQPSEQDIDTTNKISRIGCLLDICLLDHLIVTPDDYYSFAEHDLIP